MASKDFSPIKQQLALAMQCKDEASFDDFCWTGNELLRHQILCSLPEKKELFFYIWGNSGSGKSHLLQAICRSVKPEHTAAYLPLDLLKEWDPAVLEGMAEHAVVAIDDIDQIAGQSGWEEALFHLYNQLQAHHHTLVVSAQLPPGVVPLQLADLRSRLTHALILQIQELSDENKINTLQDYAKKRGLELPNAVGHFILSRCARNMHDLQAVLDRLDHASLVAQRKLTVPFVKDVLGI